MVSKRKEKSRILKQQADTHKNTHKKKERKKQKQKQTQQQQ